MASTDNTTTFVGFCNCCGQERELYATSPFKPNDTGELHFHCCEHCWFVVEAAIEAKEDPYKVFREIKLALNNPTPHITDRPSGPSARHTGCPPNCGSVAHVLSYNGLYRS